MRFTKKPVTIDAVQYDGTFPLEFLDGDERVASAGDGSGAIEIKTLEGTMRAEVGDWLIRGVKGELYPCKPDIFEETYEPAASSSELLPVRLASSIEVERRAAFCRIRIDGDHFPFALSEDGVRIALTGEQAPGVTVTILAEEVKAVDSLEPPSVSVPEDAS